MASHGVRVGPAVIRVNTHPKGQGPLIAHDATFKDCTVAELIDWLSNLDADAEVYVPHLRGRGPVLRVIQNTRL